MELLVVIGIIALLIALLLPALAAARRAALLTACSAKMQQILQAGQNHANAHRGYLPLGGILNPHTFGGGTASSDPVGLEDSDSKKYVYSSIPINGRIFTEPITNALAMQMGDSRPVLTTSIPTLSDLEDDPGGFLRFFLCPAQATESREIIDPQYMIIVPAWMWYSQAQSYIYNEAVIGWDDAYGRLRGHITRVVHADQTFLLADGLPGAPRAIGSAASYRLYELYNKTATPPVTMADALASNALAGDKQCFDTKRHRGKINVGFVDGHVETRNINAGDLAGVYLVALK